MVTESGAGIAVGLESVGRAAGLELWEKNDLNESNNTNQGSFLYL